MTIPPILLSPPILIGAAAVGLAGFLWYRYRNQGQANQSQPSTAPATAPQAGPPAPTYVPPPPPPPAGGMPVVQTNPAVTQALAQCQIQIEGLQAQLIAAGGVLPPAPSLTGTPADMLAQCQVQAAQLEAALVAKQLSAPPNSIGGSVTWQS